MNHLIPVVSYFKVIWRLFANEPNLTGPSTGEVSREQLFRSKARLREAELTPTTYLYTRVPALGSQAGEDGHGGDHSRSQAGTNHHPGIFCGQEWLCERMALFLCRPGQPPCLPSLLPAPGHCRYSKQRWVTGGEEVRVAAFAFRTFVSLIFISSATGGEVRRRRRRKRLQARGWSNKRKLAFIPGSHLTPALENLGK